MPTTLTCPDLETIYAKKMADVKRRQKQMPIELLEAIIIEQQDSPRGVYYAVKAEKKAQRPAFVATYSHTEPEQKTIAQWSLKHQSAGASVLSVVTDALFLSGSDSDLDSVREASHLPIIQYDFIIDSYQLFAARSIGADAVIIIAALLSRQQIAALIRLAYDLGLDVILEICALEELDKIAGLPILMICINNRHWQSKKIQLSTSFDLARHIPEDILLFCKNGIYSDTDIHLLHTAGINAFFTNEYTALL